MCARHAFRLLLIVLTGVFALPLGASVVAPPGSASARAVDGGPAVIATVDVSSLPHGVAVNPSTNRIFVANGLGNNVSVIDGAGNTVVATVAV
ncbi:MAG: hypothetical protein ABR978_00155, partial [Dehalococcoidia bacterium]